MLLFLALGKSISQYKENKQINNKVENINDSSQNIIGYRVTAYYVDKSFTAQSMVMVEGQSLENIKETLNRERKG